MTISTQEIKRDGKVSMTALVRDGKEIGYEISYPISVYPFASKVRRLTRSQAETFYKASVKFANKA